MQLKLLRDQPKKEQALWIHQLSSPRIMTLSIDASAKLKRARELI